MGNMTSYYLEKVVLSEHFVSLVSSIEGGMQFGNTDFTKRLSYGGGGGGGGGNAFSDDPHTGGKGGDGGGLVYLLLEEIRLNGTIDVRGISSVSEFLKSAFQASVLEAICVWFSFV